MSDSEYDDAQNGGAEDQGNGGQGLFLPFAVDPQDAQQPGGDDNAGNIGNPAAGKGQHIVDHHIQTGGQHDAGDAGLQAPQHRLDIPVLDCIFQNPHDQHKDQVGGQHHTHGGDQAA